MQRLPKAPTTKGPAAPGHFMTHIALWEAPEGGGEETTWGDHVTDAEYPDGEAR